MRNPTIRRILLALLSGALLAGAFAPWGLSPLVWIAFVPLLGAIEGCRTLKVLIIAWVQQLIFCMISGLWVFSTLHGYARLSFFRSLIEFEILCLMLAGFGAVAFALATFASRRLSLSLALMLPITWTASEWTRAELPFSFPWNLLGYAIYRDVPLIQFAEFTGVYGVSALIMFLNVSFYLFLFGTDPFAKRRRIALSVVATLFVTLIFGFIRVAEVESARSVGTLRVALISGGAPTTMNFGLDSRKRALDRYRLNTNVALNLHPSLIVWPECAAMYIFQPDGRYSIVMAEDAQYHRSLVELARQSATPILFGALAFRQAEGTVSMLNRAYLLLPNGEVEGYYDKNKLVPFGEYVPMPWLLKNYVFPITTVRDLEAGDHDYLFDVDHARLGVKICYESIFPDLTRRMVKNGADILVNLTNDAWYGTGGAEQALAMATMRTVETKRPLLRVANQGLSAVISASGRIQLADQFQAGAAVRDVGWVNFQTIYVRGGDMFAMSCVALTVVGLASAFAAMRSHRGTEPFHAGSETCPLDPRGFVKFRKNNNR